jgi:hypothetical protein
MAAAKDNKLTRDQELALIPLDAVRVKVVTDTGQKKYRTVDPDKGDFSEILPADELVLIGGRPVTMNKVPGRKKATPLPKAPEPTTPMNAQVQANKIAFLDHDPLLLQIEQGVESEDILLLVMRGFAQEAASLEFERLMAESQGKETSQLSIRRINALKALGETWIKRKEQLSGRQIDLESPAFRKLFEFMTECFRESMHNGGVSRDQAETVFVALSERMIEETWEEEARKKMRGV